MSQYVKYSKSLCCQSIVFNGIGIKKKGVCSRCHKNNGYSVSDPNKSMSAGYPISSMSRHYL